MVGTRTEAMHHRIDSLVRSYTAITDDFIALSMNSSFE